MFDISMLLDNLDNNQQSVYLCPTLPSSLTMLGVVQSHFGALEFFGGKCLSKNFLVGGSIEGLPTYGGGSICCV